MEQKRARSYEVELPVGYYDEEGNHHATVRMHKLTGHEEALLADRKLRQNGGRLITELLASCLDELGKTKPVTPKLTAELTSADRNYLLLELRKITFGSEIETRYSCPSCGANVRSTEDLEAFPVRRVNGGRLPEISVDLDDGYEDRQGAWHGNAVFRLPTGEDEEKIAPVMKQNPSKGMNSLLARCLISFGSLPQNMRDGLGTRLISDLTMGDRARIERAMQKDMPGVDLRYDMECDSCGYVFPVTLDMTNFFSLQ